jgi:hypothetical protein
MPSMLVDTAASELENYLAVGTAVESLSAALPGTNRIITQEASIKSPDMSWLDKVVVPAERKIEAYRSIAGCLVCSASLAGR